MLFMSTMAVDIKSFTAPDGGNAIEMTLEGEVGWDITFRQVHEALLGRSNVPLKINIFSFGGSSFEGLAIHGLLSRHQGHKRVVIDGAAASAAGLIAMAGDEIVMPKTSFFMLHNSWTIGVGGADDLRREADLMDRLNNNYAQVYADRTGLSLEDIKKLMDEETWLTAEDALRFGFATEVAAPSEVRSMVVPEGSFLNNAGIPAPLKSLIRFTPARENPKPVSSTSQEVSMLSTEPLPETNHAMSDPTPTPVAMEVNERESLVVAERERGKQIRGLCQQVGIDRAEEYIDSGATVDQVRAELFALVTGNKPKKIEYDSHVHSFGQDIGLSPKERKRYSLVALAEYLKEPSPRTKEAAAFELEVDRAASKHYHKTPQGVIIPWEVFSAAEAPGQTVGDFAGGGALVGTQRLDAEFIDLIRARSAFLDAGVTTLTGLTANIDIARQLSGSQHYWVGENIDVTPSRLTFGTVSMLPRTIGVRVPISRRGMMQAADLENLTRNDMFSAIAGGIDEAIAYGSGTNSQPLGIKNVTGIGAVTFSGGTSKAFPTALGGGTHDCGDWADYVDLETALTALDLDIGTMTYVGNMAVRGALKQTLRAAAAGSDYIMRDDNNVNGYPFRMSNKIQQNDVFFGIASEILVGFWGGLDVIIDPYTQSANGQVILTAHQDVDVGIRRAGSFALGT